MDWQKFETDFLESVRSMPAGSLADRLDLNFEAQISYFFELSPIQDSFRFRARHLGRRIASLLIDENGELQKDLLAELVKELEGGIYPLGPRREGDPMIYAHLLDCLRKLNEEKEIWNWIRKFSPPLANRKAEEIIRETLWPESIKTVQTFHIRRGALAAWLTLLRQTVGSCFATAPAILIQKNPIQFFKDLYELLSLGQLRRVFSGKEYAVPMCPSIGKGDLGRPIGSLGQLSFSPGLIAGLTEAHLLPSEDSLMKKAKKLQEALQDLEAAITPEQILRDLSLKAAGLTEEDVADEEYLAQIQMGPILAREGAVFYQPPSPRAQKVADWKKRFKAAKLAFLALTECSMLRVWEYTVASFCDVKTDFAKWNLYVGLGMHPEQKGGIADFLYRTIDRKLKDANEEIHRLQGLYEQAAYSVRSLESLLYRASDAQRYELQAQMSRAVNEMQLLLDERDRTARLAEALAGSFAALIQHFDRKLQEYFQEVFDPTVAEKEEEIFEDSPAGFRLLYKHGRADASTWELIYDEKTYIQSLRSFFAAVEGEIETPPGLEKGFFTSLTTELIQFIQEPEFLEEAKKRSQAAGRKTPWDYVSGGTMQTLLQAYYSRSASLTEVAILPRSPLELLRFLSKEKKDTNLLFHSPTHAFVLRLELLPEKAESKAEENAAAARKWKCSEEMQEYIGHSLSEKLPEAKKALFLHLFRQKNVAQTSSYLREHLLEAMHAALGRPDSLGLVDSHLYEQGVLLSGHQIHDALSSILKPVQNKNISQAISKVRNSFMGSYELHQTAKSILLETSATPYTTVDWDEIIASQMRRLGFTYPHLLQFADTNWSGWFFGFVANAFTGQTELWRLNRIGTRGFPMNDWKEWLAPTNKVPWILLPRGHEYNSFH
jgi:hypothetical protein